MRQARAELPPQLGSGGDVVGEWVRQVFVLVRVQIARRLGQFSCFRNGALRGAGLRSEVVLKFNNVRPKKL